MRDKEEIKEILDYLQTTESEVLNFDEDAIAAACQKTTGQSLAIKILSVFGGILASLAFLGFLFISGVFESEAGMMIFGAICIAGAIWIDKASDKFIMDTISVSSFIVGMILLGFAFGETYMGGNEICVIFIVISLGSLAIVRSYVLSFISVMMINGCILALIIMNEAGELIHIYVSALALATSYFFLMEAKIITTSKGLSQLYNPIRIGLIFSFLSGLIFLSIRHLFDMSFNYIWAPSIVIISTIMYLMSVLFRILHITKELHKIGIYVLSLLILLPTALSPAISGAILITLLSFRVNYKTGLALGIIAFIYFISQYYYDLHFTLLTKSILLFSSGVFFIVLYLLMHQKLKSNEKI